MKATPTIRLVISVCIASIGYGGGWLPARGAEADPPQEFPECIHVTTKQSLIHLGSLDSFDITERGKLAAQKLLDYIEGGDRSLLEEALEIYEEIIPSENFGGEYTALKWIVEVLLADREKRQEMLADRYHWEFLEFMAFGHFARLRDYLVDKYHLREPPPEPSGDEADPDAEPGEGGEGRSGPDGLPRPAEEKSDAVDEPGEGGEGRSGPDGLPRPAEEKSDAVDESRPGGDEGADPGDEQPAEGPDEETAPNAELRRRSAELRQRGVEDFLLFNNPARESWEQSSKILDAINLQPGEVVIDIGCGPGYFTFKFAELVGETGKVFAVDTRDVHVGYVMRLKNKYGLQNIVPVQVFAEDRHVPVEEKADVIFMCSVYHFLYCALSPEELAEYLAHLRGLLKEGGRLVIVDNGLVEDETLPYHGPYIAKQLVIRQFQYSGFKVAGDHQYIPQRYALVFEKGPYLEPRPITEGIKYPAEYVPVDSGSSLITVLIHGRDTGFTDGGRATARTLLDALETQDPEQLRAAVEAYDELIPKERFGDEYTGLRWFCKYLLAPEAERQQMLSDRHARDYFQIAAADNFALLKKYITNKYLLDAIDEPDYRTDEQIKIGRRLQLMPSSAPVVTHEQIITWGEIFTYANPARNGWEKTKETIDFLKIKPGDVVADVGSGAGYYTYRFVRRVGDSGKVYAVDTNQVVLDQVKEAADKYSLPVVTLLSKENNTLLPKQSCDMVFICTMYHAIYITSIEFVKDEFIGSIKDALKPGGRFVIADNTPLPSDENPFYGPRIQKELIIAQMKHYGFRLVDFAQTLPQRYVLVFELE